MKSISGPRLIAAWLILLMLVLFLALGVFSLTLCIYEKVRKPDKVMSEAVKAVHFERLRGKIFIGREGRRPFIITYEEGVYNGKEWVKL